MEICHVKKTQTNLPKRKETRTFCSPFLATQFLVLFVGLRNSKNLNV